MFLIVHASVGAVLGEQFSSPSISFIVGFLSHFLIDIIPHGDEELGRLFIKGKRHGLLAVIAVIDTIAALCLVSLFWLYGFLPNATGAFAGAVGAMIPDILSGFTIVSKGKFLPDFDQLHGWNHTLLGLEVPIPVGVTLQFVTFLVVWTYPLFLFFA